MTSTTTVSLFLQLVIVYVCYRKFIVSVDFLIWLSHDFGPEAFIDIVDVLTEVIWHVSRNASVDDVASLEKILMKLTADQLVNFLTPSVFFTRRWTNGNMLCFWGFSSIQNSKSLATHLRKHWKDFVTFKKNCRRIKMFKTNFSVLWINREISFDKFRDFFVVKIMFFSALVDRFESYRSLIWNSWNAFNAQQRQEDNQ